VEDKRMYGDDYIARVEYYHDLEKDVGFRRMYRRIDEKAHDNANKVKEKKENKFNKIRKKDKFKDKNLYMTLSDKQIKFCRAYINNNGNANLAYDEAGYISHWNDNRGANILRHPNVKRYLSDQMNEIFEKLGISLEYKAEKLKTIIDRGVPAEGNELVDSRAAIAAIDLFNKMQGHYAALESKVHVKQDLEAVQGLVKQYEKDY
jgi:Terminase small subunit